MSPSRPPVWFWILAGLLLVWNLMGLAAFVYDGLITDEAIALLPEAQQVLYTQRPGWVVMAFASAVVAGTAGSVALMLRRMVALPLFGWSLVSVLVQDSWFVFGGVMAEVGAEAVIMPTLVIGSLLGGLALTRVATRNGWMT